MTIILANSFKNGRKIPPEYENPIDDFLINICDKTIPHIPKWITPNIITITRMILGIVVFYSIIKTKEVPLTAIGGILFYWMDCLDGHLARATNQVTVIGDYLDHIADLGFLAGILYYLISFTYPNKKILLTIFITFLTLTFIHLGLQQKKYNKILNGKSKGNFNVSLIEYEEEELLSKLNNFHNLSSKHIKWTKYFGLGTIYFLTLLLLIYTKLF